jgi:hypothetical protein
MTAGDRLLQAAWEAGDPVAFVRVGRLRWLVDLSVELQVAAEVDRLLDAAVAARTIRLERELFIARRDATRAWALVAALEPACDPELEQARAA